MEPWGLLGALGNKRGEATSAWLLPAMPELLGYPQGIPPLPTPSPGSGEGFVGEHHFVPCFHLSDLAPWLFNEAMLGSWHSLQIGGRAGRGRTEGSGLTCWAPVSSWALQQAEQPYSLALRLASLHPAAPAPCGLQMRRQPSARKGRA